MAPIQMGGNEPACTFQQAGGSFDDLLRKVLEPSDAGRGFFVADLVPRGEVLGLGYAARVGEAGAAYNFVMVAPSSSRSRFATLTLPPSAQSTLRAIYSCSTRMMFLPNNTEVIRLELPRGVIKEVISLCDFIEIRGPEGDHSVFLCPFKAVSWKVGEEGVVDRDDIDLSPPTPDLQASITESSKGTSECGTSEIAVLAFDRFQMYWWMVNMTKQLLSRLSSFVLAGLRRGKSVQLPEEDFSDMTSGLRKGQSVQLPEEEFSDVTSGDLSDEDLGPDLDEEPMAMEETDEMKGPTPSPPSKYVRSALSRELDFEGSAHSEG